MDFQGWLFGNAASWRQEAEHLRDRHGLEAQARTLFTAADELELAVRDFLDRSYPVAEIPDLTGYSRRQVERWIKEGTVQVNSRGEVPLLDLPVKPGHLRSLLGLVPAPTARKRLDDLERARVRRGWSRSRGNRGSR